MPDLESILANLHERNLAKRIWRGDHTVWKPKMEGITDRLGWLTVADLMRSEVTHLKSFVHDVQADNFKHVVLLGMGGSSMGPSVFGQIHGVVTGAPEMLVLDSTVPESVNRIAETIDPADSLFLVSSKSGETFETLTLYRYFRNLIGETSKSKVSGRNFIAITDSGTPLEQIAIKENFRYIFKNPLDIGGRFSALSYFGLVPAALVGVDIGMILDSANRMRQLCDVGVPEKNNPAIRLGAIIGTQALEGRDKLTIVTSPSLKTFAYWIEQLIAESTGKERKGVIPISEEPVLDPYAYGNDRMFVYLRLDSDDNEAMDTAINNIESVGQPVIRLNLANGYDLGGELFRWEFATAVVGSILGINPFGQPDVDISKDEMSRVLIEYENFGKLPEEVPSTKLTKILSELRDGNYLGIMAFLNPTPELKNSFRRFRASIMSKYRVATTLGFGPSFLHSTGQLHKGGPDNGLFLQITADHSRDIPIPDKSYTFGVSVDGQALGDFRALVAKGRRVVRIHLKLGSADEIDQLTNQ